MPDPPNIAHEALYSCLRERYGLVAPALEFLPRGHDYRAGVYRVVSEQGGVYLLKATSRPLYEPALLIPRYLRDRGITAVVAPLPTATGSLWTELAGWRVTLYPFLEGETSLTGMTGDQWRETGRIFRRIHQTPLPPAGFPSMRRASFDPTAYRRWARVFASRQVEGQRDESGPAQALRAAWAAHQSTIHTAMTSLERLGEALQSRALPTLIAHADLHAANLLRDTAGHVFVLDWDEVMLAPKERDFIFIREPHAAAFWQGYGLRTADELDWAALTYFRWERVIQDLIEEAEQALSTDGVSDEARATAASRFAATFAPGGNVTAAYAAAAHLPDDSGAPPWRHGA